MPARTRRPQDYTGREADKLAAQRDAAAAARAQEITMISETEAEPTDDIIDLTEPPEPPVVTTAEVEVRSPKRKVRVNTDLENMTFGHGNNYNLAAGQQYMLPSEVADHLEKLGFVWH